MNVLTTITVHVCVFVCSEHVAPLGKPGKRYRNVNADVFVIADEDDENGETCTCSHDNALLAYEAISTSHVSIPLYMHSSLSSVPCIDCYSFQVF